MAFLSESILKQALLVLRIQSELTFLKEHAL